METFLIPSIQELDPDFYKKLQDKAGKAERTKKSKTRGFFGDLDLTPQVFVKGQPSAITSLDLSAASLQHPTLNAMRMHMRNVPRCRTVLEKNAECWRTLEQGEKILDSLKRLPDYISAEEFHILDLIRHKLNTLLMQDYLENRCESAGWSGGNMPPEIADKRRSLETRRHNIVDALAGLESCLVAGEVQFMLYETENNVDSDLETRVRSYTQGWSEINA